MKERLDEIVMAMRAARELKPGDYCNLGLGMPQMCASNVPDGVYMSRRRMALSVMARL